MANAHHSKDKYEQIAAKNRGRKRSIETRKRISDSLKGHSISEETRNKLKRRRHSEETKEKLRQQKIGKTPWNKGKKGIYSNETLEKIRNAAKGVSPSLETRRKLRESMIAHFRSINPAYMPTDYDVGQNKRMHEKIRRTRLQANGGKHTKEQWNYLKAAYNYTCVICHKKEPNIVLTKDHILSIRNGGSDDISNIQPLCRSCNSSKK